MQRGTTTMDRELPVKLSDDEIIERAQTLATKIGTVEALREKKARDAKNTQALIDSELDEIQRLARVINESEELRKQGDLTFDQVQATEVLADVAKRVLPTDAHLFVAKAVGLDECITCGSNIADPIHPKECDHGVSFGAACGDCQRPSLAVEAVESFVCTSCLEELTEPEAMYRVDLVGGMFRDEDGGALCPTCAEQSYMDGNAVVQVAGERPTWLPVVPADPAFAFDGSEPPPAVVSTHAAIEGRDGDAPPKKRGRRAEARA